MPPKGLVLDHMGEVGISPQQARDKLTLEEAWVLSNCRYYLGKLETSPGAGTLAGITVLARRVLAFQDDSDNFYLYAMTRGDASGMDRIYNIGGNPVSATNVSKAGDYAIPTGWDATIFQGKAVAAPWNGVTLVQVQDTPGNNAFRDATGSPVSPRSVASFMTYCVVGNIIGTSQRKIQWSDAGNIDAWAAGDAGNLTLYQSPGEIMKLLPLGDVLAVYREDSIHVLFYVGPPFIFAQRQVIRWHGVIGYHAVIDLGDRHFYLASDGQAYLFDGSTATAVGDKVHEAVLTWIRSDIARRKFYTWCWHNHKNREVYIFYPHGTDLVAKNAWVFNYETKAWRQEDTIDLQAGGVARIGFAASATETRQPGQGGGLLAIPGSANFPLPIGFDSVGAFKFLDDTVDTIGGAGRTRTYESGLFMPSQALFGVPNYKTSLDYLEVDTEKISGSPNLTIAIGTVDLVSTDAEITFTNFTVAMDGSTKRVIINLTSTWFAVRITTNAVGAAFRVSRLVLFFDLRGDR